MEIKSQALADFIVEFTHDVALELEVTRPEVGAPKKQDHEDDLSKWKIFVDGSSNQHGYSAGFVLQTSFGEQMENAIRMGFKATNNKAEYEVHLPNLWL